jgi:uncharacterized protein YdhG (YjbR/CyaY superfamily)
MAKTQKDAGFTAEERAAMKARAQEARAERTGKGDGEGAVRAAIDAMGEADRALAERLHALVKVRAPALQPKTWYGMPAYARPGRDGKVVCFFQGAEKFKARYATLGFNDAAQLDEGEMWPTAFALTAWTREVEEAVGALLARAVG